MCVYPVTARLLMIDVVIISCLAMPTQFKNCNTDVPKENWHLSKNLRNLVTTLADSVRGSKWWARIRLQENS